MATLNRHQKELIVGYCFIVIFLIALYLVSHWMIRYHNEPDTRFENIEILRGGGG